MPASTFTPGHLLAERYRIERLLGVGRTAEVYLAEDLSLQRTVVVKVLLPTLAAHEEVRRAFRDHIVRAATLSHPHLARVFDGGQESGAIFMITEYLNGGSLADAFDRGLTLSVDEGARLARDVASALGYAHFNGFVHGNLSPSKLLFDDEGHVRVSDIALAGLGDAYRSAFSTNDARYLSPEQAVGEVPTAKSDVYALALILFEAVTGSPAFEGATPEDLLRARLDASLPVRNELGTLDMVLAQAAIAQPDYRLDAESFANRLGAVVTDTNDFVLPAAPAAAPGFLDEDLPLLAHFAEPEARTTIGFRAPSLDEVAGSSESAPLTPFRATPERVTSAADVLAPPLRRGDRDLNELSDLRPPRKRRLAFFLLAIVVVVAGAGAGAAWKLGLFTAKHTVPSLVGLNYQQASTLLKGDGFTLSVTGHANSATVAANDILSQTPASNTSAKAGLVITVVVSDGPRMVTLPTNLTGEDCVTATAQLEKLHLAAQCPTSAGVPSTKVAAGRIARVLYQGSVNPIAVPLNATLTLSVSTGPSKSGTTPTTTTTTTSATTTTTKPGATTTTTTTTTPAKDLEVMPNVAGLTRAELYAIMAKDQLYFTTAGPGANSTKWTKAVSSVPAAGTLVKKLSNVVINVAE